MNGLALESMRRAYLPNKSGSGDGSGALTSPPLSWRHAWALRRKEADLETNKASGFCEATEIAVDQFVELVIAMKWLWQGMRTVGHRQRPSSRDQRFAAEPCICGEIDSPSKARWRTSGPQVLRIVFREEGC